MILLGLPIIFQVDYILSIWLTNVPEYTAIFVQLILLNGIIDSISKAIKTYIKATGKVKWYMIIQGGFYLLALPVIYLFLKLGYSPVSSVIVLVVFTFLGTFLRLFLVQAVAEGFSISFFFKTVLLPAFLVGCLSALICFFYSKFLPTLNLVNLIVNTVVMLLFIAAVIWLVGLEKNERVYITNIIKKIVKR